MHMSTDAFHVAVLDIDSRIVCFSSFYLLIDNRKIKKLSSINLLIQVDVQNNWENSEFLRKNISKPLFAFIF